MQILFLALRKPYLFHDPCQADLGSIIYFIFS